MIENLTKKVVTVQTMVWDGTDERAAEIKGWVAAPKMPTGFQTPDEFGVEQPGAAMLWVAHNGSWSPLPVGYRVARELDGSGFYPLSPDGARAGYEEPAGGWAA